LTVANTFVGMAIDAQTRRSKLSRPTGGLSGPAIKPLALYRAWRAAGAVRIPIIGLGGIRTGEDAAEFLLAGARAVAVGTAHFADPRASLRVLDGLMRIARRAGVQSIGELVGGFAAT
jgi:dihydroorotate dehydrogenase (NAD+) catalytic subunit